MCIRDRPRRDRCLPLSASAYPTPPRLDGPPRKSQARRSKSREARAILHHTAWYGALMLKPACDARPPAWAPSCVMIIAAISRQRFSLGFSFRKQGSLPEHWYRTALRLKSHAQTSDHDPRGSLMLALPRRLRIRGNCFQRMFDRNTGNRHRTA